MNWYLHVLKNYVKFDGRARRKEYWMFTLFNVIISAGLGVVQSITDLGTAVSSLYSLVVLLPSIAVGIRRLHDTGRSGWRLLLALIPIIGWIMLLLDMVKEGDQGDNDYGPDPKASEEPV